MAKFKHNTDQSKPGKLNKLKVNETVEAKQALVKWCSEHLCWSYGKPAPEGEGYGPGEKEIDSEDLISVYAWSFAALSGKLPKGVVRQYGAEDWDHEKLKYENRKCVWVDFTFKTELGDIVQGMYVEEKKVKKKEMNPIPLTYNEYWALGFIFFEIGLFYTGLNIFMFPDELDSQ